MVLGFLRRLGRIAWAAPAAGLLWATPSLAQNELATAVGPQLAAVSPSAQIIAGDAVRTRFVIGLESEVVFEVITLSSPHRVVVDMPDVRLQLPPPPAEGAGGLVKNFYGGIAAPGRTRVVIEVTAPVVVESARVEKSKDGKGPRLALQIVPADGAVKEVKDRKALKAPTFALGGAGLQPPMARPAKRPAELQAAAFKPIIVLDPGHGGHDSGAKKHGAVEKEVVLQFALKLREKLEKSGRYRIMMTREDDRFIELSERVDYAERNKANLFIAIHADYASTSARGATIYSLRPGQADSLKKSATRDASRNLLSSAELERIKKSGTDKDVNVVQSFLADFAEREIATTKERTNHFTRAVVEEMSETTTMRDDPDKTAGFRVLKTQQFPSVLIELAYVTNKEDAINLMSDEWRDKVSDSIMTAIENYFSNAGLPM